MRRPPSFVNATMRVFDVAVGQLLWSRRTMFMVLAVTAPIAIAVILRVSDAMGVSALRVNGQQVGGPVMFGDEVEDRTITYLFTRPIPRGAIVVGKYFAYLVCTILVVLPSVTVVYLLTTPIGGGSIGETFPMLLTDLGILALGLAVYGAVFAFVGARVPRPLVAGLVLVFGWEQIALIVPGYLRRFTVAYYLQALVPHAMPADETCSR